MSRVTQFLLVFLAIMLFAVAAGAAFALIFSRTKHGTAPPVPRSLGPTITELRSLSYLVTTRVTISDVLTIHPEDRDEDGTKSGYRLALIVRGDALLAVDMAAAKVETKNEETKAATVRLPVPEVIQPRVDHDKSRIWDLSRSIWIDLRKIPDSVRDHAWRQAQELVKHAAGEREAVERARGSAEMLIKRFYKMVDWDVQVVWDTAERVETSPDSGVGGGE